MNRADRFAAAALCRMLPGAVAPLVPARRRAEWLQEWRAELAHVRMEAGPRAALELCLGTLPDALELRNIERVRRLPMAPIHRSAGVCLLVLASILIAGWVVALRSPAVDGERHSERYSLRPGLVYLKDASAYDWEPSVKVENYRLWATSRQRFFSGLTFYCMEWGELNGAEMLVARSSANLFTLTGLPMELGSASVSAQPALVLSDALWRRDFSADPGIVGHSISYNGRRIRVAAVLPDGAWRLPGVPEAWLLESDAALPTGAKGSVLARMNSNGLDQMWLDRINIQASDANGNAVDLWALSLNDRKRGPWNIYLLAVLLACLAMPALTSVSLGERTFFDTETASCRRILRSVFAIVKFVLILGILYVVPIDVIYFGKSGYVPGADGAQIVLTFSIGIFTLWWAAADQRKRCPVCLRRVTHPAHVGIASRTFLAWNGTELFCAGGHTLLEVPDLPTSWFYYPRWVYLDASWDFLFPV